MSLWIIISFLLMGLSILISLVAWVVSILEGFKVHAGWGIANILGMCLAFVPQLLFCILKLDERWPLLLLILGWIIPMLAGMMLFSFESVLTAA